MSLLSSLLLFAQPSAAQDIRDDLPFEIEKVTVGDPAVDGITDWEFTISSAQPGCSNLTVPIPAATGEVSELVPLSATATDGTPCTYTVIETPESGWTSTLDPAGITFSTKDIPVLDVTNTRDIVDEEPVEISKITLGDPAVDGITDWEFTISSAQPGCSNLMFTTPANQPNFGTFELVVVTADDGTICQYQLAETPVAGWTGFIANGSTGEPVDGTFGADDLPFFLVTNSPDQLTDTVTIFKDWFAPGPPPSTDDWEFIVSGSCLSVDLAVTIPFADNSADVDLPVFDPVGNECSYTFTEVVDTALWTPNPPSQDFTFVPDDLLPGEVFFFNEALPFQSIELVKFSSGFAADAPPTWEFTVTSPCLAAPLVVAIPSAPTFSPIGAVPLDLATQLPIFDPAGAFCTYTVTETPVPGWTSTNPTESFVASDFGDAAVYVVDNLQDDPPPVLTITKNAEGTSPVPGDEWTFTVSSPDCDVAPFTVTVPITDSTNLSGTAQVDMSGFPTERPIDDQIILCIYEVTETVPPGWQVVSPNPQIFQPAFGPGFVDFTNVNVVQTSPATIFKFTEGDPANLPPTWEIHITSTGPGCLSSQPQVELIPAVIGFESISIDLRLLDDNGASCRYTATEIASPPWQAERESVDFFASDTVEFVNFEVGATAEATLEKFTEGNPGDPDWPAQWDFVITADNPDCLAAPLPFALPLTAEFETAALPPLPIRDASGLVCLYTITETPVAGWTQPQPFEFTIDSVGIFPFFDNTRFDPNNIGQAPIDIFKETLGGFIDESTQFEFTITSACLASPLVVTVTLEFGAGQATTDPLPTNDATGAACVYTVTETPDPAWISVPGTLNVGAGAFIQFANVAVGDSELVIEKTAAGPAAEAPTDWVFEITGPCLGAPQTVTIPSAATFFNSGSVSVTLPPFDLTGPFPVSCEYFVTEIDDPTDGFTPTQSTFGPVFLEQGFPTRVAFENLFEFVEGEGLFTIIKQSFGDPATAPADWEFVITGPCLSAPLVVTMPSAPTFDPLGGGSTSGLIPAADANGNNCTYTVTETPSPPFVASPSSSTLQFFPGGPSPQATVFFSNTDPTAPTSITIIKEAFGDAALLPPSWDFEITSPQSGCLAAPPIVSIPASDADGTQGSTSVNVDRFDEFGSECFYEVTEVIVAPWLPRDGTTQSAFPGGGRNTVVFQNEITTERIVILGKTAQGDGLEAPDNWEFTITSSQPGCTTPTVVTIPTGPTFGGVAEQDFGPLAVFANDGALCSYTAAETPVDGYITPEVVTFAPGADPSFFTTRIFFNNVPEDAEFEFDIFKFSYVNGNDPVPGGAFEFTVTSSCPGFAPLVVEIAIAGTLVGASEVVSVPAFGPAGEICEYTVAETNTQGFVPLVPPQTLSFGSDVFFNAVFFSNAADDLSTTEVNIQKQTEGDLSGAPDEFEFTITSPNCDLPNGSVVVTVDSAATAFPGTFVSATGLPFTQGGESCSLTITETPVPGYATAPPQTIELSRPFAFVTFVNVSNDSQSTSNLTVGKTSIGDPALAPESFTIEVTSSCLSSPVTHEFPAADTFLSATPVHTFPGLPVQLDGEFCSYEILEVPTPGWVAEVSPAEPVVLNPRFGKFVQVTNMAVDLELVLNKTTFGIAADAPATFDFTVSSDCLAEDLVVSVPGAATFEGSSTAVAIPFAGSDCEYTVTEADAAPFSGSGPVTVSPMGNAPMVANFTNTQIVEVTIDKTWPAADAIDGVVELPSEWTFTITSACLDQPLTVTVSTGDTFPGSGSAAFDLPVANQDGLCSYSVAEETVAGWVNQVSFEVEDISALTTAIPFINRVDQSVRPEPTTEPTPEPTAEPTTEPTAEPTTEPTAEPTTEPTTEPTAEPTSTTGTGTGSGTGGQGTSTPATATVVPLTPTPNPVLTTAPTTIPIATTFTPLPAGRTVTPLAITGTESTDRLAYGLLFISIGSALIALSKRRQLQGSSSAN